MKCVILSCLLLLLFSPCSESAKGGAKSMMGRKRQQQGSSNSYSGYHGHSAQRDKQLQEFDGSGDDYDDYESAPPCIGLCLLRKSQGLEPPPPVVTKPCVGKCQHGQALCGALLSGQEEGCQERKRREEERKK